MTDITDCRRGQGGGAAARAEAAPQPADSASHHPLPPDRQSCNAGERLPVGMLSLSIAATRDRLCVDQR